MEIEKKQYNRAPGLLEFSSIICSTENCIGYMRSNNLLRNNKNCECGEEMHIVKRKDISDGQVWKCPEFYNTQSIRKGTVFNNSRLSLKSILSIIYYFGQDFQVYQTEKLSPELNEKSIMVWYSYLRDVCSNALVINPVKLGQGVNADIVEIDESLFGKKRKFHRGSANQKFWVFGMVERGSRNALLQFVDKRDKENLIPIIQRYVEKGATIYSDMWGAYNNLSKDGYIHETVNHSKEFVSASGCCTNTKEGLWGLAKLRIKKMKGILPQKLSSILDEFMYRYKYGHSNGDIYYRIIQDISIFNDV